MQSKLKFRPTGTSGHDIVRTFSTEDGVHYRGVHQNIDPIIEHVKELRDMNEQSRISNPNGWKHIGSMPFSFLLDWLNKNNKTIDEYARDHDMRQKCIREFLTRDNSKLHNMGVGYKRFVQ